MNSTKQICYIDGICANALAYADDIVILSPSCSALKILISIWESFEMEYEIICNPDKSSLLSFSEIEFWKIL